MNRRTIAGVLWLGALVLIGVAIWWFGVHDPPGTTRSASHIDGVVQDDSGKRVLYWHDPMVPGHKFDRPGKSPFMDMQLVPRYAEDEAEDGIRIAPSVMQNLGVRVGPAEQTAVTDTLIAVGRIAFDEHSIDAVQTRTAGFVERLYVRAEGERVKAGQKVADIYAPELLAAQHELVALDRVSDVPDIESLRAAARTRLRLLGMRDAEIRAVEKSGEPLARVGVYAPAAGIVRQLGVRDGARVMPGETIVQVAGLERVWVLAELTEGEAGRVRNGQAAEVHVDAVPGQTFEGKVDYVYPQLDAASRTVPVRIEVPNKEGVLRPGMYARVTLRSEEHEALTVPSEAVIATGKRKVVLLQTQDRFVPVEVQTGREAGGRTEVLSGLRPGDEVVLSGQFLIDSEASLSGLIARLEAEGEAAKQAQSVDGGLVSGEGIVEEMPQTNGVITMSHDPIPALQWPAMTMEFKLRDPAAATKLKPGARVRFEMKPEPEGGDYIIESIETLERGDG